MIAEQMEAFATKLIHKTNDCEVNWQVLAHYPFSENGYPDFISRVSTYLEVSEFCFLLADNSFFFLHDEGIVALLRTDHMSGKDRSQWTEYALAIQIRKNAPVTVCSLPELQELLSILYNAILNNINGDLELPNDLYKFMQSC